MMISKRSIAYIILAAVIFAASVGSVVWWSRWQNQPLHPNFIAAANASMALGTMFLQACLLAFAVYVIGFMPARPGVFNWLKSNGLLVAFIVAAGAAVGSLFYSNYAGFEPCDLCWYQRIFMYPLAIMLGLALWYRERHAARYALPLAWLGLAVSAYQNYLYYLSNPASAVCQAGVSCVNQYVLEFGYVTIPLMSLTAFAAVIVLLTLCAKPDSSGSRTDY